MASEAYLVVGTLREIELAVIVGNLGNMLNYLIGLGAVRETLWRYSVG
jgi:hypothetical protein